MSMEVRHKVAILLLISSLILWSFSRIGSGIALIIAGFLIARNDMKSSSSTIVRGIGLMIIFGGIAAMMTKGRSTVLLMGMTIFSVFLIRGIMWRNTWIEHNFYYLILLAISSSIVQVSKKWGAFISSLMVILMAGRSVEDEIIPEITEKTAEIKKERIMEFVEDGDKAKLIAYVAYISRGVLSMEELEGIIRMILEYRDSKLPLRKRRGRKKLVEKIIRIIEEKVPRWVK